MDVLKVNIYNQIQTTIYFKEFHEHKDPIVYPGNSECEFLFGKNNAEKVCARLLSMGPQIVVIKLGKDGCIVADNNNILFNETTIKGIIII
ncbi:hypothetical protein DIC82_17230 [Clostridium beijerinckii]|nr:hypothetical protein DIC82_17230 [Clostridium beijerinckii]